MKGSQAVTTVLANVQVLSLAVAFSGTIAFVVTAGTLPVPDYRPCPSNTPSISVPHPYAIRIDQMHVVEGDTTTATLSLERLRGPLVVSVSPAGA